MAVINAYVTTNAGGVAADVDIAARFSGGIVKCIPFSFEVAAADDNASIYRIGRVSPYAIPLSLQLYSDAIAGPSDAQFGVYKPLDLGGDVVDVDNLAVSVDITAGKATITEMLIPTGLAQDEVGKSIGAIAGISDANMKKYGSLDLAITTPTGVTAAGTIAGFFWFIDGV